MKTIIFTLFAFISSLLISSAEVSPITWGKLPSLPDKHGFAGGYAGVVGEGEDRWLVFGGGANFPYENPFDETLNADGGQPKVWHDAIYAIQLEEEGLKAVKDAKWTKLDIKLPQGMGYGGSLTLKKHKSALFIGGATANSKVMVGEAYEITRDGKKFAINKVATLPIAVGYVSAEIIKEKVYLVSGKSADKAEAKAWVLDTKKDADDAEDKKQWTIKEIAWPEYEKGVPANGRMFATLGAQADTLYLIGGRQAITPTTTLDPKVKPEDSFLHSETLQLNFFRDCYAYNPKANTWKRIADLPRGISAAPSRAVPTGATHLTLLGGGDAATLRKVNDPATKQELKLNSGGQGFNHPGFPRDLLSYHSITNQWIVLGQYPEGEKVPVTAPVVIDGGATDGYEYAVISGEWSPKLRNPSVHTGLLKAKGASFGIVNWIIVVVYLLAMVGIGYWFMQRESATSTDDYFRGGQRIPWWVAGLSIFATVLSSITFMAVPALSYEQDWNKWVGQWPIVILVPLVVFFYLPFFRKLNVTSAYEYLEARFNLAIRLIASASFMIFHVGRIAIVLYLPALALSSVTDINIYMAISVIGLLCVVYTVMGGIEAVVWTDAIQALVLIGGALLCFILVVFNVDGGLSAITDTLADDSKFLNVDWSLKEACNFGSGTKSGWLFFFGFFFASLPNYTAGQDVVQRYVTTPTEKEAAKSLWLNVFMTLFGSALFFALGTALYVYYNVNPVKLDPTMTQTDGILPFFIMQNLPIGVSGLIVAGVFAAAQSTISSSLNSLATSFVTDYYKRVIAPKSADSKQLQVARNVVIAVGIVGILSSIWIANQNLKSAFDTFNMFVGFVLGPLAAMFALGVFTKHVGGKACLIGAIAGSAAIITVTLLNKAEVIDVWSILNGLICFVVTFVVAFIAGFIFPADPEQVKGLSIRSK